MQVTVALTATSAFDNMSDPIQQLTSITSAALHALFSSGKVTVPVDAMELLTKVITSEPHRRLSGGDRARSFRLTDLARFESILESLSRDWEHGLIYLQHDEDSGSVTVIDVQLGTTAVPSRGRKRKHSIDEDADSAAGDMEPVKEEEHDEYETPRGPGPRMANLSKELKEVYAILQRGTAKGRLLAEEVSYPAVSALRSMLTPPQVPVCSSHFRAHLSTHDEGRVCKSTYKRAPLILSILFCRPDSAHRARRHLLSSTLPPHYPSAHRS